MDTKRWPQAKGKDDGFLEGSGIIEACEIYIISIHILWYSCYNPAKTQGSITPQPQSYINGHILIFQSELSTDCGFAFFSNPQWVTVAATMYSWSKWWSQIAYKSQENTYPETNVFAPEHGWLKYYSVSPGENPIFRGEMAVCFREGTSKLTETTPLEVTLSSSQLPYMCI